MYSSEDCGITRLTDLYKRRQYDCESRPETKSSRPKIKTEVFNDRHDSC